MKTSLAKAVALAATLGVAASAQAAISLEPNGQGQVLLFPLYTVDNGNDTAISVTNTTNEFKAVKVRFREALNSQDVLDFHLFLSPEDVWNGVVVATDDGAKLITRDSSCTVPAIPADGQPFTNIAYNGTAVETVKRGADGGPQDLKRTRVGYAEIIELGVLDRNLPTSTPKGGGGFVTFGEAIKHVNGVPGNCGAIINEYLNGRWVDGNGATKGAGVNTSDFTGFSYGFLDGNAAVAAQVAPNTTTSAYTLGGLYGVGTVTNVFAGQQIGYDATAIDGFIDTDVLSAGNLHNATGFSFPDLNGNRTPGLAIDEPAVGISASKAAIINGTTYTFAKAIDAVSAVLQRTQLNNEFSVDAAVGGGTDWVVTFPTKHHYVWDSQIAADGTRPVTAAGAPLPAGLTPVGTPVATPVADYLSAVAQENVSPFQVVSLWKGLNGAAKSEVPVTLSYLDREEKKVTVSNDISFSPRPSIPNVNNVLSNEANVITFNNSNVLVAGDSYARYNWNLETGYKSGWASIGLVNNGAENIVTALAPAATFVGLPALGFATIKVTNGDLNGVLSNYNAAWNHKSN